MNSQTVGSIMMNEGNLKLSLRVTVYTGVTWYKLLSLMELVFPSSHGMSIIRLRLFLKD